MKERKKNVCPICAEKNGSSKDVVTMAEKIKRIKCKHCKCVYLAHNNFKEPIYNTKYNLAFYRPSDIKKAGLKACEIAEYLKENKENEFLLEIGSGNGLLTKLMELMGWNIKAIEIEPSTTTYLQKLLNINVVAGKFEYAKLHKIYTFIYASHVIEHTKEPMLFLKNAKNILKKKGLIYLETPDIAQQEKHGADWKHFNTRHPYEHIVLFASETIQYIACQLNLKILKLYQNKQYESLEIVLRKD